MAPILGNPGPASPHRVLGRPRSASTGAGDRVGYALPVRYARDEIGGRRGRRRCRDARRRPRGVRRARRPDAELATARAADVLDAEADSGLGRSSTTTRTPASAGLRRRRARPRTPLAAAARATTRPTPCSTATAPSRPTSRPAGRSPSSSRRLDRVRAVVDLLGDPQSAVPRHPRRRHQRQDLDRADDRVAAARLRPAHRPVHQPAPALGARADPARRRGDRPRAVRRACTTTSRPTSGSSTAAASRRAARACRSSRC